MNIDLVNIGLALIEGIALIVSPCILPVLPIILSGSLEGSKKRPFGIICGFVLTFAVFTFFSKSLVVSLGVNLTTIRIISYVFLILFGLVMLSGYLTEKFMLLTQRLANVGSSIPSINQSTDGFFSGIIFGGLIGIIWTPCAGPILAVVLVQTVLQTTTLSSFLIVLAFGVGAAIPMLLIALFGREIIAKFQFFKTHSYLLRKILGVIIIASVIYMIYGENVSAVAIPPITQSTNEPVTQLTHGVNPYSAPEIAGITAWINSQPLLLNEMKGKVVLIDFWAYSCINCIRTLPYLKDWYQKYRDKGFVIIGVHAPEFQFEHDFANVKNAVEKDGIQYPVALDNNFVTWQNYKNQYWPAHYLIDKNGNVVYQHFGEGDYDVTENNIRYLLGINTAVTGSVQNDERHLSRQTPETYLGYARANQFASPETVKQGSAAIYTFPDTLKTNQWALSGLWTIDAEKIMSAQTGAILKIHFYAGKVFIVMGNASSKSIKVKVLLNDVVHSSIEVKAHNLYEVITFKRPTEGTLQMIPDAPGLEVFTFTFGT